MKLSEKGFTMAELLVALPIFALLSMAATMVIFQIFHLNGHNNDYMTSVRQVENAGYWIGRDTQMARGVSTDNLTFPDFLILKWTEWNAAGAPIYHSVRYIFKDMTNGVGRLERYHWSSAGASEQTHIAQYVYYDSGDEAYTSRVSYQNPILAITLTSSYHDILESRQYKVVRRPYF